jgi:hypothetical protein
LGRVPESLPERQGEIIPLRGMPARLRPGHSGAGPECRLKRGSCPHTRQISGLKTERELNEGPKVLKFY